MPGLIVLVLVVWALRNAALDVTCAAKGIPNPRYEARIAEAKAAGRGAVVPGYGTSQYFRDFWADLLAERTAIRRRRYAGDAELDAIPVSRPWLEDPPVTVATPRPAQPAPQPAPQPRAVDPIEPEAEAVDDIHETADVEPVDEAEPHGWKPRIVRDDEAITPEPTTEETTMTTASSEVIGLTQSIDYATRLAQTAAEHAPGGNELYIGQLTGYGVGGECLASGQRMQAAFEAAAAAAEEHKKELDKQLAIQQQYDANRDAGDKAFMQDGR